MIYKLRVPDLLEAVFAVTGIGIIILYIISGSTYGYHMTRMGADV